MRCAVSRRAIWHLECATLHVEHSDLLRFPKCIRKKEIVFEPLRRGLCERRFPGFAYFCAYLASEDAMTEGHCNDQGIDLTGYRLSMIDLEKGSECIQIL